MPPTAYRRRMPSSPCLKLTLLVLSLLVFAGGAMALDVWRIDASGAERLSLLALLGCSLLLAWLIGRLFPGAPPADVRPRRGDDTADMARAVEHFLRERERIEADRAELRIVKEQLAEQNMRMRHMAHHDALTGLPNRALLDDRLKQAIAHAQRHRSRLTVAFIDLDNFKLINDSLGHDAGDALLKAVAQRMQACVRGSDTVARLGGDEFVLVLCDQPEQPQLVAGTLGQIRDAIAQAVPFGERLLRVTCSMGLATYPADGADGATLMMHADVAMYRAKALGRNNFQFYYAGTASMARTSS